MALDVTIQKKLAIGFGLGPVILAIVGWIAYSSTTALLEDRSELLHSYKVLQSVRGLRVALTDAETGERGYVLTGRDPYLTPYQDAAAAVQAEMGRLNALTAGNPQHQARLQALRPLVKAKLEELAEVIRVRSEEHTSELQSLMRNSYAVFCLKKKKNNI